MSLELLHTGGCSTELVADEADAPTPDAVDDTLERDLERDLAEDLFSDGEDELRLRRVMQRLRDHIESECDVPRPRDPSRAHRSVAGEIQTSAVDT